MQHFCTGGWRGGTDWFLARARLAICFCGCVGSAAVVAPAEPGATATAVRPFVVVGVLASSRWPWLLLDACGCAGSAAVVAPAAPGATATTVPPFVVACVLVSVCWPWMLWRVWLGGIRCGGKDAEGVALAEPGSAAPPALTWRLRLCVRSRTVLCAGCGCCWLLFEAVAVVATGVAPAEPGAAALVGVGFCVGLFVCEGADVGCGV